MKTGFYNNHSFKAQNVGAGGVANLTFQGFVNFGNDTNNALDTGFGYANAATGVFTQYLQASKFVEGSMLYNNTEVYVQDNWKVNSRLTLDYGVRFTHQQPQYDQFQQMSNFFPDQWSSLAAPTALHPGLQQRRGHLLRQHAERDGSAQRSDSDGAGRSEHAGGHRHAGSRHRQPAERHPARPATALPRPATPGRRSWSDRGSASRMTSRATRASSSAAAAASSTTVRTATRCSRSRATRQSRPRRTCATASCRRSARA